MYNVPFHRRLLNRIFKNHIHIKEYGPLVLLSILIGIIGGLGAILFRIMIKFNKNFFFNIILPRISFYVGDYNLGVILLPALGGLIVGPLIYKFAREAKGHGVPEVIEAVHMKGGVIRPVVAFIKIIVSSITIGSGGSAGREGPIAQIGAVFGSIFGQLLFKTKKYVRLMVSCGVAAGISATFNAPLGGALFAMEIIATDVGLTSAIPILLSAVIGDVVTGGLMGFDTLFLSPNYIFSNVAEVPIFFIVGIIFGILSHVWSKIFYKIEYFFDSLKFPEQYKPVLGGLIVGIMGMFFLNYGIMGVGYEDIVSTITGKFGLQLLLVLGVLKIFSTSFTIGSGASGGIFAPSLYIGSMFGAASGLITQHYFPGVVEQPYAFALIGMGALFSGACRAPVTALVMIPEMTGNHQLIIPMIIVSTLSYFVASIFSKNSMYLVKLENKGIKIKNKENVLEDIKVKEIMTKHLDYVHPNTKVSEILDLMMKMKHPGFPVVYHSKKFLGFITIYRLKGIRKKQRDKMLVKKIAYKEYPYVSPEDSVYHALNIMIRHNYGRIPVLVKKNRSYYIKGVISKTDVIRAYGMLMK